MRKYKISDYTFSDWTNKMLNKAEEIAGQKLTEKEIFELIDDMLGYVAEDTERLEQSMSAVGLID